MGEVRGAVGDAAVDATLSNRQAQINKLVDPPFFVGTIHDVFSHTGAYIVRVPGGRTRMGVLLADVSNTPFGARAIGHLQIGDAVCCLEPKNTSYIYILGAVPLQIYDPRFVLPDSLVMRSMVGILQDQMHYSPYQKEKNNLANFSGGRPIDTLEGDWGYINEFGMALWLGKMIAQMRASDIAKMEMFWGDDLVRLFGWNFELFTGGREARHYDDEGEYIEVDRWTPFGWESLGAYKPGVEIFEDNEGESGGAKKGNEKSRYEPKEDKQIMVFRGQALRGYIGNGINEQIAMLPVDGEEVAKADDGLDFRGLSEVHRDLDGSLHLRSAKQVILEKSLIMPVPRQLLDPDAPDGDTGTGEDVNYKPANYYGSGGPEQERKPYKWSDDERPDARNTDLLDYHAYLFGKYALAVIDDHEKDWEAPEEADLKIDDSKNNEIDSELFTPLEFQFSKDLPKYGEITIDQREGHDVRYYQSRSCIHLADDGSVIIEDGYGSQIHMSGGNIHMTCQGDIFSRPGRSAITWAPRDIINKAGWCAEISASKGDVRVKGENNVHIMAGDDTKGCLLLECRAEGKPSRSDWTGKLGTDIESKGIILKAKDSVIDAWAKDVFVGTHKDEDGRVEINGGGAGRVIISAKEIGNEALQKFGALVSGSRSRGSGIQFNMESGESRLISKFDIVGDLGVWQGSRGNGDLTMDGKLWAARDGWFAGTMKATAVSATSIKNGGGIHVGPDGEGPDAPNSDGPTTDSKAVSFKSAVYTEFDTVTIEDTSIGPGTETMQDAIGFSFRTSKQYKAEANDFIVFESRWQQLYRVSGPLKQWKEPAVRSPDDDQTRPHPGHVAWEVNGYYKYSSTQNNVNLQKGVAKGRDQQSEEEADLTAGSLMSDYVINIQEEEE